MIFGSSFFFVASVGKGQKGLETEGQRDRGTKRGRVSNIVRQVAMSHCPIVSKKNRKVRDRGTKRQSEVSAEIFFVHQVAMSHCPIVSKKNSETTHTFYDLWYSKMAPYHNKLAKALHLYKMSIDATLIEKLLVCTLLGNTSLINNVDAICIVDGTKTMSNDNRCSTLKKVC